MTPAASPLPNASKTTRGAVTTGAQDFAGPKGFDAVDLLAGLAAVSGAGRSRFRQNANTVQASVDGRPYRGVIPAPDWVVDVGELGILPSNTGAQNSDAIDAAFAAIPIRNGLPIGQRWQFGYGIYEFARTINVIRSVGLCGVTGMAFGGSQLHFPGGVTGIILNSFASFSGTLTDRADWATLSDLYISSAGHIGTTAAGVYMKGFSPRLENVEVVNFAGNGFHIQADTNFTPPTNCNLWRMTNCRSGLCGGHGLYVVGGDANAGSCIGLDAWANGGYGVYDDSFLGNTYIACATATNGQGSYWSRGASSRNLFLNCYSEGDDLTAIVDAPSMVLGGLFGGGLTGTYAGVGAATGYAMTGAGGKTGTMVAGPKNGQGSYLTFYNSVDANTLEFKFGQNYGGYNDGWYAFNIGHVDGLSGLMIAGQSALLTSWPMRPQAGRLAIDDGGFYVNQNRFTNGPSLPVGTCNKGDEHNYSNAGPGDKAKSRCTSSGTSGSYTEGLTATSVGGSSITLNGISANLAIGAIIVVNGSAPRRIQNIVGAVLTLSGTVPAGSGLAIVYSPPTWTDFALL